MDAQAPVQRPWRGVLPVWVNGSWVGWSQLSSDAVTERWARITQRIVVHWIQVGSVLADHLHLHSPNSFAAPDPPAPAVQVAESGEVREQLCRLPI